MKLIFGGVRGTTPIADKAFLQYGGSTTSFMIESQDGETIVIDVGTGTRTLTDELKALQKRALLILMTHYHQDHLIGFPGFPLIYDKSWRIEIKGPTLEGYSVGQVFNGMMRRPFWPLQIDSLQAEIEFSTLALEQIEEPMKRGALDIRWCPVHHLGGCLAYRIDEVAIKRSVIIATDIEWGLSTDEEKQQFLHFCSMPDPADVLVFDGHFTPENYEQFIGYGHSTWQDGVDICKATGIRKLYMTHHAQGNDDACLMQIEHDMQADCPDAVMARQGMVIHLEK